MRAGAYSPNHIGNDAAIFNATADQLRKRGCAVNIYSEDQFNKGLVKERIILNMCREQASIKRLQQLEDDGCIVVNSGYGIENCTRERMTRILLIEDDDTIARGLAYSLEQEGWTVTCFGTLAEGRAALEAGRFDLLLADVIATLHPDLLPGHEPVYTGQLPPAP